MIDCSNLSKIFQALIYLSIVACCGFSQQVQIDVEKDEESEISRVCCRFVPCVLTTSESNRIGKIRGATSNYIVRRPGLRAWVYRFEASSTRRSRRGGVCRLWRSRAEIVRRVVPRHFFARSPRRQKRKNVEHKLISLPPLLFPERGGRGGR